MTRGNWQRRVELNESRRAEAKEKKHRNEEKRNNKARVQEFFKLLDGSWNQLIKAKQRRSSNEFDGYRINVWVNVPPSDAIPLLDMVSKKSSFDDDMMLSSPKNKRKGKKRSSSIEIMESDPSPRKPSNFKNKKKAHPRSHHQPLSSEKQDGPMAMPKLCRSHFFHGKCRYASSNQGKKGGGTTCAYAHYETNSSRTMADIVNSNPHAKKSLFQSEQALPSLSSTQAEGGVDGDNDDAMDMVFYLSIPIIPHNDSDIIIPSEYIVSTLNEKSCNISSIQYLTMDEFLVFDRYQGGGLTATEMELVQTLGATSTAGGSTSHTVADRAIELPSSVLEDILLFLPDSAVALMSSVCKTWNIEIGKQSTNLWRHLLQRRGWPIPDTIDDIMDDEVIDGDQHDTITLYRESFLAHYAALRDIKALASGADDLLAGGGSSTSSTTKDSWKTGPQFALQNFAAVEGSPPYGSHCLAIQVWSPNHILAAFSNDCTIRLYTAASRGGKKTTATSSRDNRSCRELICHSMDPYKNTKRKKCQLLDMAMDDDMVGCLFRVVESAVERATFVLTTVRKEDFLSTDDLQEEDVLNFIDIGQCMLNFILSYDDETNYNYHGMEEIWRPAMTQLKFAIASGGCEMDDIEVLVSDSLESCGYGRFLLDVMVSIPSEDYHDDDDDDSDLRMTVLFRNIVLFSSSTNSIVWMTDVPNMEQRKTLTLACTKTAMNSDTRKKIAPLVVGTELAPLYGTWCVPVKYSGNTQEIPLIEYSISLDTSTQEHVLVGDHNDNPWMPISTSITTMINRPLIVHDSEIIIGDTWWKEVEEDKFIYKSTVLFHPIVQSSPQRQKTIIEVSGNLAIVDLVPLRKTHVLALCWKYPLLEAMDDVDGQWFGDAAASSAVEDNTNERFPSVVAVILDIQNRTEISRVCLVGGKTPDPKWTQSPQSIKIITSNDTLGAVLWWKGIVMAGRDIQQSERTTTKRYGGYDNFVEETPRNVKTKKKKTPKKGSKKDGFARGMSLRG